MSEVQFVTGAGVGIALDDASVEELRQGFRGDLLRQGDEGYDGARKVWNGMFDRHPGLIARVHFKVPRIVRRENRVVKLHRS